jgi:TPR repeat protein
MNALDRLSQGSWLRSSTRCGKLPYLLLIAVLSMFWTMPGIAGMPEAEAAYQRGDFNAAFNELKPLAEQGNAAAQALLGALYRDGKGVSQDYVQALGWLRKASSQGYDLANVTLESMYSSQQGITKQEVRDLALHGDVAAQSAMAAILGNTGNPRDLGEAYVWLKLVASNPNAGSLTISASMVVTLMERGLTPAQIAEGKELVERFKAEMPAP